MLILTHPADTSHSRGPRRKERSDWPSRVHPCGAPEIAGSFSAREPQASYTAAASSRRQTTPPFFFPLGLAHGRVILSIPCPFDRSFSFTRHLGKRCQPLGSCRGARAHPLVKDTSLHLRRTQRQRQQPGHIEHSRHHGGTGRDTRGCVWRGSG